MPDVSRPDHLPNRRPGKSPPHPSWLPRQRRGTTPQMIGRYPDFDVFDAFGTWDDATKRVVLARLEPPGPLRFFTPAQEPTLRAFCDTVLAQDTEPRVPVAEMVDTKLADATLAGGTLDGYQYADMPDDRDTWRLVLAGLDHTAMAGYHVDFAGCTAARRENIVGEFAQGRLVGGAWEQLNVTRAWSVVMRAALAAFYSHPWAWNEIGFGGPAYPRGFLRLGGPGTNGAGAREPFETPGATDEDPVREVEGERD
ncbi:MAG: gluconate 2-dehydrogenase subunit 3 family protein [Pseudonocardiaceae bacterium]